MLKNRALLLQIAVVAVVFILGLLIGRGMTGSHQATTGPAVVSKSEAAAHAPQKSDFKSTETAAEADNESAEAPAVASGSPSAKRSLEDILHGRSLGNRAKELQDYVSSLSGPAISGALKQLRHLPDNSARDLANSLLVTRWIETDPEAALQFASDNHDFDYIAGEVFQQFAAENVDNALARAQTITDANARSQALRGVLSFKASQDPMGALRMAATLGNLPNGESLTQMIYRQWSEVDPQAAAAQAAQEPAGQDRWNSPVGQVLRNWAAQDPLAAIAWTTSLPDQANQTREIGQIVRQWSRDDLNAAANWVNTVPAGPVRDAAAASLAFSISQSNPTAAVGWVQSIGDASQRENAMQRLSREIMYRNPTNGAAILLAAGIPQNQIPQPPNPNRGGGRRGPR